MTTGWSTALPDEGDFKMDRNVFKYLKCSWFILSDDVKKSLSGVCIIFNWLTRLPDIVHDLYYITFPLLNIFFNFLFFKLIYQI